MSTKRIREALQALATFTGAEGDPMTILSERAMAEVDAIKRAAKAWAASDHGDIPEDLGDLMESIAKEAS